MGRAPAPGAVIVGCANAGRVFLADLPQLKILGTIVVAYAVFVMHAFMAFKKPAELAFDDKAMLGVDGLLIRSRMVHDINHDVSTAAAARLSVDDPRAADHDLIGGGGHGEVGAMTAGELIAAVALTGAFAMTRDEAVRVAFVVPALAVGVHGQGRGFSASAFTKSGRWNPAGWGGENFSTCAVEVVRQIPGRLVTVVRLLRKNLATSTGTFTVAHAQSMT